MSRQPRIDTSVRQQVYSYVETPIELNGPGLQPRQVAEITESQGVEQPPSIPSIPSNLPPQPIYAPQQRPTNTATHELDQARQVLLQERRALSPDSNRPPEHPALSAPYAEGDVTTSIYHRASMITHSSSQHHQSPPYSPGFGPVPEKRPLQTFEPVSSTPTGPTPTPALSLSLSRTTPITPDTNPLQSPTFSVHRSGTFTSVNQDSQDSNNANHQPGQSIHPNQVVNGGHWSTGLCDCSDPVTCVIGLTCPCALYGRTQYKLLQKSRGEDPTNLLGFDYCNGSCCSCLALSLCGCQCILATIQHYRTRKAYAIEGNVCSDCVKASCCMCCTFVRNEREIKRREEKRAQAARLTGSTFVIPYAPPAQMQYPNPGS